MGWQEAEPGLPIQLGPRSNGEFVPEAPSPVVREAVRRARFEADRTARRLGMSRRRFLASLCGSAVTLVALNACSSEESRSSGDGDPGGTFDLPPESTTEPEAAAEALAGDEFIMDVQSHLLEYSLLPDPASAPRFGRVFPQANCGETYEECYSIETFLDLMFLQSDTSLIVISAIPIPGDSNPLSIEVMEETRRVLGAVCEDDRILVHGQAFPGLGPPEEAREAIARVADEHDIAAWKLYTHAPGSGAFFLDDHDPDLPQVGEAFIEQVREVGPPIIAVHKGFGNGSPHASPVDIGPAAIAHPDVSFVVYHSGFDTGIDEGPFDPAGPGVDRLVASLDDAGIEPGSNVYAELGSTWRAVMGDPDRAAHVVGKLLVAVGEDNVVWGTDSIWYGTPQDQIQAFRAFSITEEYQERFGYPALTDEVKAKIFGLNSAELYGVDPEVVPCEFTPDDLQAAREAAPAASRRYGPETAAQVAQLQREHGII